MSATDNDGLVAEVTEAILGRWHKGREVEFNEWVNSEQTPLYLYRKKVRGTVWCMCGDRCVHILVGPEEEQNIHCVHIGVVRFIK